MPQDKSLIKMGKSGGTGSSRSHAHHHHYYYHHNTDNNGGVPSSTLPPAVRVRLYELFVQIEKEFECLYTENMNLQEKIEDLQTVNANPEKIYSSPNVSYGGGLNTPTVTDYESVDGRLGTIITHDPVVKTPSSTKAPYSQKLRCHTNKLRAQTTRIMSNLKNPSSLTCTAVRRYTGHKDGIWEVSVSRMGLPILGTASADHTANIWGMHSGQALLQYAGHSGSVNSIRFHPSKELVLTASGDGTVHIWQCAVHLYNESSSGRVASSEDELDPVEKEFLSHHFDDHDNQFSVLRTPLRSLNGHNGGVVIAADWMPSTGEQAVTAGWDRLACIWDTQTGQLLQQLAGHDEELTHTAAHPTSRLIVTSSKDSTFRLWDFRESIHSVSVFQGHQDTVTSAVFTREDKVVSGSDDRSVKIWDLRNMRTPVATVQSDSAVNRLSVSPGGIIAIPFDNRNVRLYELNGQRVARLPRSSRQGHSRMVCSTAWCEDYHGRPNLFTCGFDRVTIGWSIQPGKDEVVAVNPVMNRENVTDKTVNADAKSGEKPSENSNKSSNKLNLSLRSKELLSMKENKDKESSTSNK